MTPIQEPVVTKADIVELISREVEVQKKDIAYIIDSFFGKVKGSLSRGEMMELRGFGTFGFKVRKARQARNPRTNERVEVPEHLVMFFKPGKEFKEIAGKVSIDIVKERLEVKKRAPDSAP